MESGLRKYRCINGSLSKVLISGLLLLIIIMLQYGSISVEGQLTANFYNRSCPNLISIVRNTMRNAVRQEPRMAASILRLFFHDCFVQGCDASLLLDDTSTFQGEKTAFPNNNSIRGFEVIDTIKANVEAACPGVVSCADILALASREGVILSGGPFWNVLLGRRDSTTASLSLANSNLPAPTDDVDTLKSKFKAQGLSVQDMVTLSGGHTIGDARCTTFKSRLYGSNGVDPTLNSSYATFLESVCPSSGGDNNLTYFDVTTPFRFDNKYFTNLILGKGLLTSDQELFSSSDSETLPIVQTYSQNMRNFFGNFTMSMINMGNINPVTGSSGQIRTNCRVVNA